jgi:tRNA A-37 threonylcarbamoyl transferase component Bud32
LHELHKLNIIHADVALRNIIKKPDGSYCLIDYGCSFSIDNIALSPLLTSNINSKINDYQDLERCFIFQSPSNLFRSTSYE